MHAGILDDDQVARPTVIEAIVGDERLTSDQRHTLITVYESFLAQNVGPIAGGAAARSAPASAAGTAKKPPARPAKAAPRPAGRRESTRPAEG